MDDVTELQDVRQKRDEAVRERIAAERKKAEQTRKALEDALQRLFRTADGQLLRDFLVSQTLSRVYQAGDALDVVSFRDGHRALAFDLLNLGNALEV